MNKSFLIMHEIVLKSQINNFKKEANIWKRFKGLKEIIYQMISDDILLEIGPDMIIFVKIVL